MTNKFSNTLVKTRELKERRVLPLTSFGNYNFETMKFCYSLNFSLVIGMYIDILRFICALHIIYVFFINFFFIVIISFVYIIVYTYTPQ